MGGKGGGGSDPIVMPSQNNNTMEMMMPMMQMMMQMSGAPTQQAPEVPQPVPQPTITTPDDMAGAAAPRTWQEVAEAIKAESEAAFDETQDDTYTPSDTPPTLEDDEPDTTESLLG